MKKTLIALVALSGLAMAEADYTTTLINNWNFSNAVLPSTATNSIEVEGLAPSSTPVTLTLAATTSTATLSSGTTNRTISATPGEWATVSQMAENTASGESIWSGTLACVGTYVSASAGGLTITLSNLDSNMKYNLSFVSGYDDSVTGSWNEVYVNGSQDYEFLHQGSVTTNSHRVPKNQLGSFALVGLTPDADGNIKLTIDRPSNHVAVINGLSLAVQTPNTPEPATATLSLLALAGLAARRRRH